MKPSFPGDWSDLFGFDPSTGVRGLTLDDIRARLERKDCAECNQVHADLRPWPPDDVLAHRYCGACRLAKAVKL